MEQLGLACLNDDILRRARLVEVDGGFRELRQANWKILIGARIIDAPAADVAIVCRSKGDAGAAFLIIIGI